VFSFLIGLACTACILVGKQKAVRVSTTLTYDPTLELPEEIHLLILNQLDIKHLAAAEGACSLWYRLAEDVWKKYALTTLGEDLCSKLLEGRSYREFIKDLYRPIIPNRGDTCNLKNQGWDLLIKAVREEEVEQVRSLIDQGADPSFLPQRESSLIENCLLPVLVFDHEIKNETNYLKCLILIIKAWKGRVGHRAFCENERAQEALYHARVYHSQHPNLVILLKALGIQHEKMIRQRVLFYPSKMNAT
jgi:hypothetical protein